MAAPTVTSITPNTGTYLGGTAALVAGTGFSAATAVTIGGQAADFEISSATLLAVSTPAGSGASQVIVTNADGSSANAVNFTYSGSPVVFSVAEARAFDKAQLTNATTYPSATIITAEANIRAKFERILGIGLTATTHTEYYDGDNTDTLYLNHHNPWAEASPRSVTLTSVTVISTDDTETAFTAAELSDVVKYPERLVRRSGTFASGSRNIKVVYSTGYTTVPDDIKQAAMRACVQELMPTSVPSSVIDGSEGQINWSRVRDPERGRWYGNESIDAVLREHRMLERLPVIL